MKQLKWIGLLLAASLLIGCSGGQGAAGQTGQNAAPDQAQNGSPDQPPGDGTVQPGGPGGGAATDPTAAAAFQDINRLAAGTLFLKTSAQPVTKDQAVTLLPYWQTIQASRQAGQGQNQAEGADAQAMIDATANIRSALTADQLALIDAMTEEEMAAIMQQYGANVGRGGPGGNGQSQGDPGAMQTAQALGTPMPGPGEGRQRDPGAMQTAQALGTTMPGPGDGPQGGNGGGPQADPGAIQTAQALGTPMPGPGQGGWRGAGGGQLIEAVIAELQALANG